MCIQEVHRHIEIGEYPDQPIPRVIVVWVPEHDHTTVTPYLPNTMDSALEDAYRNYVAAALGGASNAATRVDQPTRAPCKQCLAQLTRMIPGDLPQTDLEFILSEHRPNNVVRSAAPGRHARGAGRRRARGRARGRTLVRTRGVPRRSGDSDTNDSDSDDGSAHRAAAAIFDDGEIHLEQWPTMADAGIVTPTDGARAATNWLFLHGIGVGMLSRATSISTRKLVLATQVAMLAVSDALEEAKRTRRLADVLCEALSLHADTKNEAMSDVFDRCVSSKCVSSVTTIALQRCKDCLIAAVERLADTSGVLSSTAGERAVGVRPVTATLDAVE